MHEAGRNRIEVYHRRSLAGHVVDHYVVDFRIAVEHALLQFARSLGLFEANGESAALLDEFSQSPGFDRSAEQFAGLGLVESSVVRLQIAAGYVKAGQRIVHGRGVHVAYQIVKVPKRGAAFHCVLGALGDIEGMCTHYAGNHAPDIAPLVRHIVCAVLRLYYARHLPYAIVASRVGVGLQLFVAMLGDLVHVLHYEFGLGEHVAVDPLENHLRFGEGVAVDRQISVVYVSVAYGLKRDKTAFDAEFVYEKREFHASLLSVSCRRSARAV